MRSSLTKPYFTGRAVARALAKAGYTVRVLTRDPQAAAAKSLFDGLKIELVRCDYNDLKSVQDAFEGVDIVFGNSIGDQELFMSPPGAVSKLAMSETEQGKRYADVAKAQGVKLFVWSVPSPRTAAHDSDALSR